MGRIINYLRMIKLDEFDYRIVRALSVNSRRSNLELEKEVRLSHSAISRRIARLEEIRVIEQYTARINLAALGLSVRAFVAVTREPSTSASDLATFLLQVPGVIASYVVTGEQDVLLEIVAEDLTVFADIMLNSVQTISGVATTKSIFVMREGRSEAFPEEQDVKSTKPLTKKSRKLRHEKRRSVE